MTRSERLQPIVRISESKRHHAEKKMAEAMRRHREAEERLRELQRYRDEYERSFQRDGRQGVGAEKLRDYRSFVAQLSQAIGYQQRKVDQAAADCEAARRAWLKICTRCQALDKVVDNHRRAEQKDEARREQRDLDERARDARGVAIRHDDE